MHSDELFVNLKVQKTIEQMVEREKKRKNNIQLKITQEAELQC